ncbi:MAG TPA: hypothetical protein VHZ29_03975 [Rhizomicrobium sp.]|nr:hypothetical protein [Rhizomicrobium sp.]
MTAWDEMLDEFRALGGTAENIRLGDGALGRGIFPIDPSKPVAIRIPENLLMETADAVFENGAFRVRPDARIGARERAFLELYEERFSWGGGGRRDIALVFEQAQALPAELRERLRAEFRCGDWFGPFMPKMVEDRFLASRCIGRHGRMVVMPIVELANHGDGADYDTSNGVSLGGNFAGEVLVRYSQIDPYGLFLNWGFAYPQPQALSIALSGNIGSLRLRIARDLSGYRSPGQAPRLMNTDGVTTLDFLALGDRENPRRCKGAFHKLARGAGLSGFEEAFDTIQHANRMHFLNLLAAVDGLRPPMAHTLRRMARHQLEAMSFAFGAPA